MFAIDVFYPTSYQKNLNHGLLIQFPVWCEHGTFLLDSSSFLQEFRKMSTPKGPFWASSLMLKLASV
jgi:hypothetical protein